MTLWRSMKLTGWGRTSAATVPVSRPERLRDLITASGEEGPLLVHGLGRSYGDAAVPPDNGRALLLHRLDRLVSFDEASGLLVAEAGVTFSDLMNVFLPRGWLMPVMPGTSFVTLGGALASNIHGKNHPTHGALSRHVEWIDLILPDGTETRVSRSADPELFFATLGGMGLTGVIVRAAIRLMQAAGPAMAVTSHRVPDLDAMMGAFLDRPEEDVFAVAWLDALARGKSMGRGIFERAHSSGATVPPYRDLGPTLPFMFPNFALNPLSIAMFNRLRYAWVGRARPTLHPLPAKQFFYPLDRIGHWHRMYGRRGFHQFQAVIPDAEAPAGIRKLLETISSSRQASFLAVLKRLGGEDENLLGFARKGFTLALDFPNNAGTADLVRGLIRITRDYGGRIYLAKDSIMAPEDLAAMYPRLPEFRRVLERVDPAARMSSRMAVRLGLRSAA